MNELVKVFSNFLGRDLVYIFSGSIPLLVACRIFCSACQLAQLPRLDVSAVWIVFTAGVAYVVGLALQELACLLHITSTSLNGEPLPFTKWLYRCYTRECWKQIDDKFDAFAAERWIDGRCAEDPRLVASYERLISLMQAGTTLGPSLLLSGIALLACTSDKIVAGILVVLGVLFLCFGWLKRAQAREFAYKVHPAVHS